MLAQTETSLPKDIIFQANHGGKGAQCFFVPGSKFVTHYRIAGNTVKMRLCDSSTFKHSFGRNTSSFLQLPPDCNISKPQPQPLIFKNKLKKILGAFGATWGCSFSRINSVSQVPIFALRHWARCPKPRPCQQVRAKLLSMGNSSRTNFLLLGCNLLYDPSPMAA